jgi:hypothetical protein
MVLATARKRKDHCMSDHQCFLETSLAVSYSMKHIFTHISRHFLCSHLNKTAHLVFQNRTWGTFTDDSARNTFSALLMGALWFGGTMVYGIGESLLGDLGAVCSISSLLLF